MTCDHRGSHTGALRYLRDTGKVRLLLLCDECGAESIELGRIDYRPNARRLVGQLAELTAQALGLSDAQTARVRLAALVSDIGRSQIPPEILGKRGPLTDDEWTEMRRQPELGAALLSDATFDQIRDWILCYRERPDGKGYPRGLRLEEIPLEARILAVADAYVAMISDRPHRSPRQPAEAEAELLRTAGTQFDAAVVEAFLLVHAGSQRGLAPAAA